MVPLQILDVVKPNQMTSKNIVFCEYISKVWEHFFENFVGQMYIMVEGYFRDRAYRSGI
jgi:hypothetical protein